MRTLRQRLALLVAPLCLAAGACAWWPGAGQRAPQGVQYEQIRTADQAGQRVVSSKEVQLRLQRFGDRYTDAMVFELDKLRASEGASLAARRAAMDHALSYPSAAIMIASAAEPAVAMLDLLVFVRLVRMTLEEYWVPEIYGPQGEALLATAREFELAAWDGARLVLTREQIDELRDWVREWREANPERQYVEWVRFSGLASHLSVEEANFADGLIADVRRATRSADAALDLSERMLYVLQRAPFLWTRHAEMAVFQITSQPEIQGVLADSERLTLAAERLSIAAERLTDALVEGPSPEQEALLANLDSADQRLRGLMAELRETLAVSSELVTRVDTLAAHLERGADEETTPPPRPFDILEYQATAAELGRTAAEYRALIESASSALASPAFSERLPQALVAAGTEGEELIEYFVLLAIVAIVASIFSMVGALLGYRYAAQRLEERWTRRRTQSHREHER